MSMERTVHSTREMLDRYNTVDAEDARQAVTQMEKYLLNVTRTVIHEASEDKKEVGSN